MDADLIHLTIICSGGICPTIFIKVAKICHKKSSVVKPLAGFVELMFFNAAIWIWHQFFSICVYQVTVVKWTTFEMKLSLVSCLEYLWMTFGCQTVHIYLYILWFVLHSFCRCCSCTHWFPHCSCICCTKGGLWACSLALTFSNNVATMGQQWHNPQKHGFTWRTDRQLL